MSILIDIKNFCAGYYNDESKQVVFDRVNLEIHTGETLGISGATGCGKSLFARSLVGLNRWHKAYFQSGQISFRFSEPIKDSESNTEQDWIEIRKKEIGFIFQYSKNSLNPTHRIAKQLSEVNPSTADQKQILLQLAFEDPIRILDSYPHQISGGQAQRILIAIALLKSPKLVIADEPTSSLDSKTATQVMSMLQKLKSEYNFTLLLISHDKQQLSQYCDRIYLFESKQIVAPRQFTNLTNTVMRSSQKQDYSNHENVQWIKCQNLTKAYQSKSSFIGWKQNKTNVLIDFSFEFRQDQNYLIYGASGSGKSTLAAILCGLQSPTTGTILTSRTLNTQMIFQDSFAALNPKQKLITGLKDILGAAYSLSKAQTLFDLVKLPFALSERLPHELSGGERQRFCIARALAINPDFLIFDEALSSLNDEIQLEIINTLFAIKSERPIGYIFISHQTDLLSAYVDETIELSYGYCSPNTEI